MMYDTNTGFRGKTHNTKEMFHFYRLKNGNSTEGNVNFFKDTYFEGNPLMGIGEEDVDSILSYDVSDSGVSESFESLYLTVSENYNGDLYRFKDGGLDRICKVNQEIYKFELESMGFDCSDDSDKRYTRFMDMRKMRINYMNWIKGINFKYLMKSKNVLPLAVSSSFVCFTESKEIWIYKYDNSTNKIQRLLSFNINHDNEGEDHDEDEFILYCIQSEWRKMELVAGDGDEQMYTNFVMLSNKNRIIVKKCYFSIENNLFIVDEEEQRIDFEDHVINYKILENDVLCVILDDSIEVMRLGDAGALKKKSNVKRIPLELSIALENFICFKGDKPGQVHTIACNSLGEMHYMVIDTISLTSEGTVSILQATSLNYWNEIDIKLPIFDKINSLQSMHGRNERVYIDSLSVDEEERLVFMTSLKDNSLNDFEFVGLAGEKEPIRLSIVESLGSNEINFLDVDEFNAITASCNYWICAANIAAALDIPTKGIILGHGHGHGTDADADTDASVNADTDVDAGSDNHVEGGDGFDQLFNELFMNSQIQRARVQAVISGDESAFKKMREQVQSIIRERVLDMVSTGKAEAKNEMDMLMVALMQKSTGVCCVHVLGTDMIEYFDGGAAEAGTVDAKQDGVALSRSGHLWRTCTVTGVPLVGGPGRSLECTVCGAKRMKLVDDSTSLVGAVLRAAGRVCCVCGGRWG
jgi:hypothetical protein